MNRHFTTEYFSFIHIFSEIEYNNLYKSNFHLCYLTLLSGTGIFLITVVEDIEIPFQNLSNAVILQAL